MASETTPLIVPSTSEAATTTTNDNWRVRLYDFLEAKTTAGKLYEKWIIFLIVLNVFSFVFGTLFVEEYNEGSEWTGACGKVCDALWFGNYRDNALEFLGFGATSVVEVVTIFVFTVEYVARLLVADLEDPKYAGFCGRLRYVPTFFSLVDLLSTVPFYVDWLLLRNTDVASSAFVRMFRLLRMMRAEGRYDTALTMVDDVWHDQKAMMGTALFVGLTIWLTVSTMYYCTERLSNDMIYCGAAPDYCGDPDDIDVDMCTIDAWGVTDCTQAGCPPTEDIPEPCYNLFQSIPMASYYALLNCFGEYPLVDQHNLGGKIVGTITAILAVAFFALPTGIVGNGFENVIEENRKKELLEENETAIQEYQVLTRGFIPSDTTLRAKLYAFLHMETTPAAKHFDYFINILVILTACTFMLSTIQGTPEGLFLTYDTIELIAVVIFTVEYVLRVYSIKEDPKYQMAYGRLLYMTTFLAVVDLLSFAPYLIEFTFIHPGQIILPYSTTDSIASNIVSALRLLRIFRFEKYTHAFLSFDDIIRRNRDILAVTGFTAVLIWIFFSAFLYLTEKDNPDEEMASYYNNMPNAMWITLLNLSGESPLSQYSVPGKVITGILALFATGVFGIPIGILGSGFEGVIEEEQEDTPDEDDNEEPKEKRLKLPPQKLKTKCLDVLKDLQIHQHGWAFNSPADAVSSGTPDSFEVIKSPMDLGTIRKKLENGGYNSLEKFEGDVHLVFDNAMQCNKAGSPVYNMAEEMNAKFNEDFRNLMTQLDAEEDTKRRKELVLGTPLERSCYNFVNGIGSKISTVFEISVYVLILSTIAVAVLQTVKGQENTLHQVEWIAVIVFTFEYLVRFVGVGADPEFCGAGNTNPVLCRLRYIVSFYSIIDLLAIIPFYLAYMLPESFINDSDEYLRMFRILRLVKLDKYVPSITLIDDVIRLKFKSLKVAVYAAFTLSVLFAALLYIFEHDDTENSIDPVPLYGCYAMEGDCTEEDRFQNYFDTFIYTTIHLTGDYPIIEYSWPARFVNFFIVVCAVGVVSIPSGLVASGFMEVLYTKRQEEQQKKDAAAVARGLGSAEEEDEGRGYKIEAGDDWYDIRYKQLKGVRPRGITKMDQWQTAVNRFLNGRKVSVQVRSVSDDGTEAETTEIITKYSTMGKLGRIFIFTIIILNIVAVIVESIPTIDRYIGNDPGNFFDVFEAFSVFCFLIEYLLRLFCAPKNREALFSSWVYATTFFGIVDLLSTAPWFVEQLLIATKVISPDDGVARIFRIFRVFRILQLEDFFVAFSKLDNVFRATKDVFKATGLLACIIWVGCGALFYIFEENNPNWRQCDAKIPLHSFSSSPEEAFIDVDNDNITAAPYAPGCYDFSSTAECNEYYGEGSCTQSAFTNIPNSLFYTAVFLVGEWGVVDFTWPGRLVCIFLCVVGIALYAIPTGALFDSFASVIGLCEEEDDDDEE